MENTYQRAQLYLRLALGIGFILPVADRLGWLGPAGRNFVDWGNWENFVTYTNSLMPFFNRSMAGILGFIATIGEAGIGLLFLIGFRIKEAAMCGFLLLLSFALCMAVFLGIKSPFNYSVLTDSAACLLLALLPTHRWSIDYHIEKMTEFSM
ncbi:hypothetical protein [Mucilaginibacter sp.]|uniref:hypothetical protein n=1 Tax=Mucilaginibacter sp. TaxID=1882438 RepID=UPI0025E95A91|nr:hypothetical protein [Mucilaginibacter sp.]